MPEILSQIFENRDELTIYVKQLAPWAEGGHSSEVHGGRVAAEEKLQAINPMLYERTRNFGDGYITRLSPYIRHGILSLNEVRNHALNGGEPLRVKKFIQQLAWRDFWQHIYLKNPEWIWNDIETYKTGYTTDDYTDELPLDIINGTTGVACLDHFINELTHTGYIHNHARMYLASYIVHFRRIKWQTGARWFLHHLLDGDPASNNLSWQWVASTFSNQPYIFNLENVDKYFGNQVNTSPLSNQLLHASYEELNIKLFPKMEQRL